MGIVKKLGKPITAARPQNRPQQIRQGAGGAAADSQIAAPPAPFQNPLGVANFQRFRTNGAATKGVGDGRSRNTANVSGSRPMSDGALLRGAGYRKPVNYAGYKVHLRGKPLIKPMSNDDFAEGAKLYRKEHGGI